MRESTRLCAGLLLMCLIVSSAAAAPAVAVKLNVNTATLHAGETKTFSATVSNSQDTAVAWFVDGIAGGNAAVGTVAAGKYQAPAVISSASVTVKAVSHADNTKSDSALVTLLNAVPAIASIVPSQVNTKLAFTLTINGTAFDSDAAVKFDDGTVVQTGFVSSTQLTVKGTSASAAGTQIHVTVTNPGPGATTSAAKAITVAPPIVVTVSPKTKTIRGGDTLALSAHVANNSDQTVTWSVNGTVGGSATNGTIDSHGVYTAPVIVPAATVTIAAASVADPTKSDTAVITLNNPIPVITTATTPLNSGAPATITITGKGFSKTAAVLLGAQALTVQWVDATKLVAKTTGALAPPVGGVLPLKVVNPDPGGASSNVLAISVQNTGAKLSYQAAKRFLEQASWGPTPASIAHLQDVGADAWITEQFAMPASQYALPIDDTSGLDALQKEFFVHAIGGPDQLRQRVAFALGQIVVVSENKLPKYAQMMPYQQMLLNDAFGTYKQLLKDVTLSPAMGHFLDMVNNDKPSKTTSPNENYARESMQLFSIGLVQLNPTGKPDLTPMPTYTEDDVHALARIFTGWTYPPCLAASKWTNPPCWNAPMVAFDTHHDLTAKTFLGATFPEGGTAEGELDHALAVIEGYTKPGGSVANIAPFIALRLIQHLVTSNPSTDYVSRIAGVYKSSGGDLKTMVRAILQDTEAVNGAANPTGGHLREPVFYVLSLLRGLNAAYIYSPPLNAYTAGMAQDLFNPNSVFNYYSPFYHLAGTPYTAPEFQILNQSTAFARANYSYRAVHNQLSGDIRVDLSDFTALAADIPTLLNAVSQALLGAPMSMEMAAAITPALLATTDPGTRAMNAVYLVAVSSEYQVVR